MHGLLPGTGCNTRGSNWCHHWDNHPHYSTDVQLRLNSSNCHHPPCGYLAPLLCCCHCAAHRAFRSISKFWSRIIHHPARSRWLPRDKHASHISHCIKSKFTTRMWLFRSTAAATDGPDLLHSGLNVQRCYFVQFCVCFLAQGTTQFLLFTNLIE